MHVVLRAPSMDKGWGVEVFDPTPAVRAEVVATFGEIKQARPFLQCDSAGYLFVEFWTDEEAVVSTAAALIESRVMKHAVSGA